MDEILHHLETVGNLCWLAFTGNHFRVTEVRNGCGLLRQTHGGLFAKKFTPEAKLAKVPKRGVLGIRPSS